MKDPDMAGLATRDLKIGYDRDLIDRISINVLPGKIVTLIGPNGSGKSTLLKTVMGSLKSRGGLIYLSGRDRGTMSQKEAARSVSMVMTRSSLPTLMTCREVIEDGRYPYTGILGKLTAKDHDKVSEAISMCGCEDVADRPFTDISDGQRQRVLLARAIAQDPKVLVLDEPTSYLDIRYKTEILTKIRELATAKDIAVLMSVHEPDIAMKLSDTVVAIGDGQVLKIGGPEEVFCEEFIRKLYKLGDMEVGRFSQVPWIQGEEDRTFTGNQGSADGCRNAGSQGLPGKCRQTGKQDPATGCRQSGKEDPLHESRLARNPGGSGQIMIQGTMSNVGKSLIAAGLCRIFAQDGYSVAPFKSQNMANNSYVTGEGLEMGRAQVMQAECAMTEPIVSMNPILLKPVTDRGSQVVVCGKVVGNMDAREYFEYKKVLIPVIKSAYEDLKKSHDIIVIEGAGSPAEINLKDNDIVNMGLAKMTGANVVLVGDIDRGGVFAQLMGTLDLLEDDERSLVKGLIINRFRGDKALLDPGIRMLEEMSARPVTGVIPYMDLHIDDEDSLSARFAPSLPKEFDIAVIKLPHIANSTDMGAFEQSEEISVRYIREPAQMRDPDMIVIPGTKNTIGDMKWLDKTGLSEAIRKAAKDGTAIIGICGGYQILGRTISDPEKVESAYACQHPGLGLLDVTTVIEKEKTRRQFKGRLVEPTGLLGPLKDYDIEGYEIHMGKTGPGKNVSEFTSDGTGYCSGNIYGTYVHGLFDRGRLAATIIERISEVRGKNIDVTKFKDRNVYREEEYDRLADTLRQSLDMDAIYKMAGLR